MVARQPEQEEAVTDQPVHRRQAPHHRGRRRRPWSRAGLAAAVAALALLVVSVPAGAATARVLTDGGRHPPAAVSPAGGGLSLRRIATGFSQPLFVTHAGDGRLFVVEQGGKIKILKLVNGTWKKSGVFLDISGQVSGGSEQGLLGLAFHPDYATNGRFYVDFTNRSGDTIIAEYRRQSPGKAAPGSQRRVLKVGQPYSNHNGGWIAFKGPYLYVALGDGGNVSTPDPGNRGQRLDTLLGKILRIDPIDPDGSGPKHYRIPSDNPFVGRAGRDEIWAYGLRNPWRDAFDRQTGDLWIGDVGQGTYEEIDHAGTGKGRNFGWRRLEGKHLYPSGSLCSSDCRTLPVIEYRHSVSGEDNCSVTGGYVARRSGAPLFGRYIFGDYCSGRIWNVPAGSPGGALPSPLNTGLLISSFGEGQNGALYVVHHGGAIYRIVGS
jgi:glucose/arabinose dehydrogenase